MKCYIVDDVLSIVKVLSRIIKEKDICEIIGTATDPVIAEQEIISSEPDIVLVDLLMPVVDGITLVKNIKKVKPNINFIMISQVSDSEMVAGAYQNGIEFFIRKPINAIEVETVIKRLIEKINLEKMLGGIRMMVESDPGVSSRKKAERDKKEQQIRDIRYILGIIGVIGEKGTKDIMNICVKLVDNDLEFDRYTILKYAKKNGEDERMVKQRIRRAVKKALGNMAAMGVEDYYNEIFQTYSYMIFDFESIRSEMDFIRGKNQNGGKASISKFIEGLMTFTESKE